MEEVEGLCVWSGFRRGRSHRRTLARREVNGAGELHGKWSRNKSSEGEKAAGEAKEEEEERYQSLDTAKPTHR